MISRLKPTVGKVLSETPARLLTKAHLTPNWLTFIGLLFNVFTAWVLAIGELFVGGFLVLISGWFDMLDGAMARMTGKASRFGAFFDSSVDRLSEAALFLGLLIFYADGDHDVEVVLIYVAIIASIMVSYTRARAESLGLKGEVGLLARPERVVILTLGLLLSGISWALTVALWILAVGASLTAIRRIFYVWQQSKSEGNP